MFNNRSILITGGAGLLGHTFDSLTLAQCNPCSLVNFSRDEMKLWEIAKLYGATKLRSDKLFVVVKFSGQAGAG